MNDDRRDDSEEPVKPAAAGEPAIPAGAGIQHDPPAPVTPDTAGGVGVPTPPPTTPTEGPQKPADYYAQSPATPEGKKGCGKWAIGCGVAGCLVGLLLIAAIVWILQRGWPMLMTRAVTEVEEHIAENGQNIDPSIRAQLEVELRELKRHIQDRDLTLQETQGVVYSIQDILGDNDITTSEAEDFLEKVKRANEVGATGQF